jgi:hypothetical protein
MDLQKFPGKILLLGGVAQKWVFVLDNKFLWG